MNTCETAGTVPPFLTLVVVGDEAPPPQALSNNARLRTSNKFQKYDFIDEASL
jgi:hypothetical protein